MTMPPGLGDDVGGGCWSVFPLLTDRLRLRPLRGDDAPRIRACVSNSAVATRTLHIPHPLPDGAESLFLHDVIEERAAGRSVVCAIEQREGGVLIGVCGLSNLDWSAGTGEVGYWLAEEAWGLGYASEALAALLAHAFDDLKLSRVHAHVLADQCGFRAGVGACWISVA